MCICVCFCDWQNLKGVKRSAATSLSLSLLSSLSSLSCVFYPRLTSSHSMRVYCHVVLHVGCLFYPRLTSSHSMRVYCHVVLHVGCLCQSLSCISSIVQRFLCWSYSSAVTTAAALSLLSLAELQAF